MATPPNATQSNLGYSHGQQFDTVLRGYERRQVDEYVVERNKERSPGSRWSWPRRTGSGGWPPSTPRAPRRELRELRAKLGARRAGGGRGQLRLPGREAAADGRAGGRRGPQPGLPRSRRGSSSRPGPRPRSTATRWSRADRPGVRCSSSRPPSATPSCRSASSRSPTSSPRPASRPTSCTPPRCAPQTGCSEESEAAAEETKLRAETAASASATRRTGDLPAGRAADRRPLGAGPAQRGPLDGARREAPRWARRADRNRHPERLVGRRFTARVERSAQWRQARREAGARGVGGEQWRALIAPGEGGGGERGGVPRRAQI